MPLERAKDSLIDLVDQAEASAKFDSFVKSRGPDTTTRDAFIPACTADSESESPAKYWQPGEDWRPHKVTRPLEVGARAERRINREEKRRACFPFLAFFCDPREKESIVGSDENLRESPAEEDPPREGSAGGGISSMGGIARHSASVAVQDSAGIDVGNRKKAFRRPETYRERTPTPSSSPSKYVRFNDVVDIVIFRSMSSMTKEEKSSVWWQTEDFNRFSGANALLSQPEEMKKACQTWLAGRQPALVDITIQQSSGWWHKYGDSRRGLEKYASSFQSVQILESYREAVQRVLEEQKRQRFWRRNDPEKLARVYSEYNAWSRDLALAAGASDADAVVSNFDDLRRKSREYFLLKQIYRNDRKVHRHMPDFMIPSGFKPKGYLEENENKHIIL